MAAKGFEEVHCHLGEIGTQCKEWGGGVADASYNINSPCGVVRRAGVDRYV